jgi:hypothetical protein
MKQSINMILVASDTLPKTGRYVDGLEKGKKVANKSGDPDMSPFFLVEISSSPFFRHLI